VVEPQTLLAAKRREEDLSAKKEIAERHHGKRERIPAIAQLTALSPYKHGS